MDSPTVVVDMDGPNDVEERGHPVDRPIDRLD